MRYLILLLALFAPVVTVSETWLTDFPEHKERVFEIVRKGEKISEWTDLDGRRSFLIDYKKEMYLCVIHRSYDGLSRLSISCADANYRN